MKQVAILSYQGTALFELGCAVELFGLRRPEFDSWYSTEVVTFDCGLLGSTCGVSLGVKKISSLELYDMLVVPSWPTEKGDIEPMLAKQIRQFQQSSKTIISFCSGAFLLAELGVLDQRKATTHWRYAELFKQRFKQLSYIDDVLYIFEHNIGCSAGSAAAIDLGLEVIRRDYGSNIAKQVARRLVMAPHRKGGQSQYVETPLLESSSVFDAALRWALSNLASEITINDLATRSNMSRRTFDRRFRNTHGCSAKQWITTQRINLARAALEQNQLSVERIAQASGFENANVLRHHFRNNLGVSPRQYRDQFSSLTNHSG
ncbi:MAG: helix-turn-helix domain-containing protein [Arenicella sp.]|nr:helix-turn-helix domain-containing protein [Arenicella sp.]